MVLPTNFGFLDLSTSDLIIILAIVLLLFGSRKLPELSKSLGSSLQELRKGLNNDADSKKEATKSDSTEAKS